MAANSIASELLSKQNSDFTSDIKYLSEQVSVDTADFDGMIISQQFWLDTKTCVKGYGKCRKINVSNLYEIFGGYSLDSPDIVKQNTIKEINNNPKWYEKAGKTMLTMKGTTFQNWFKHMKKARTRADELMLFVLCVLYHRHCIVYTKWQPWHTVNMESKHDPNTIEEMCETKLLFLGNDLYGELHRLPMNHIPQTPCSLADIQSSRLIDLDKDKHCIQLTVIGVTKQRDPSTRSNTLNSVPTDGSSIIDVKPSLPRSDVFNIFSDEYASLMAIPKTEPDTDIKIEPKTEDLKITDVRTLGTFSTSEPSIIRINPSCVFHGSSSILNTDPDQLYLPVDNTRQDKFQDTIQETLEPETMIIAPLQNTDSETLQEATNLAIEEINESTPTDIATTSISEDPLDGYCYKELAADTLQEATKSNVSLLEATATSKPNTLDDFSVPMTTLPEATQQIEPLQEASPTSAPILEATNNQMAAHPESTNNKLTSDDDQPQRVPNTNEPLQDATRQLATRSENKTLATSRYYFCLSPGESEVLFLHHDDIVSRKCSVKLVQLSEKDISMHTNQSTNTLSTESSSSECGTKSDPEWNSCTKPKRPFKSQPLRVPSKSRIAAQKIIEENNKRKRK